MITGQVQGVGFRPLVCRLARELGLAGRVWNDRHGVVVEAEGDLAALAEWERRLVAAAAAPARIATLTAEPMAPRGAEQFEIAASDAGEGGRKPGACGEAARGGPGAAGRAGGTPAPRGAAEAGALARAAGGEAAGHRPLAPAWVPPDLATCAECLAEMQAPGNRRHGYPFINCTHCGPRYTIIGGLPYDRPQTTMAVFTMCPACQAEYDDAANRRFHAQPNACPECGPQLTLTAADGRWERAEALAEARRRLAAGEVVAIKGLGGFHLACDAANAAAVARLRRAKQRPAKPFAVMVRDLAAARELAEIGAEEAALLASAARPIVVVRARGTGHGAEEAGRRGGEEAPAGARAGGGVAAGVAPGQTTLGIFLPYTPLHHLLFQPPAPAVLVMTSGNRGEEPLAIADGAAEAWLREPEPRLAQAVLGHNRAIRWRADDSVVRVMGGAARVVRRGRGYAPEAMDVGGAAGDHAPPVVGLGAESKNACCLTLDHFAVLGPHVGDWGRFETEAAYAAVLENLLSLWGVQPQAVGYDPHPGYAVSAWGRRRFARLPQIPIQHHHAHIAAVLAEHRRPGPVIGLAWDGTGWGPDGTVWGGEVLVADRRSFTRWAHLRQVPMPGGEQAVREPWRMALAQMWDAAGASTGELRAAAPAGRRRGVEQMLERGYPMPWTSSCGRLFDAVAALAGLGGEASYEGQLAVALEAAAEGSGAEAAAGGRAEGEGYAVPLNLGQRDAQAGGPPAPADPASGPAAPEAAWELDTRPLIRAVLADAARGEAAGRIAARFHTALAEAAMAACRAVRARTGIGTVALGGGSWQNARLLGETMAGLEAAGFEVLTAAQAPVNDGGLGLGQAVVAQALLSARGTEGTNHVLGDSWASAGAV